MITRAYWAKLGVLAFLILFPSNRSALASEEKLTFVAYGDSLSGLGNAVVHQALLKQMQSENPALVIHTGNMVASGGRSEQWEQFLAEGQGLFATATLMPVPGDQDRSKRGHYARYTKRDQAYYSFVQGPARFIALDTTQNFAPRSRQYRFLVETLETALPGQVLIVYFHHPPFSGSLMGGDSKVEKYLVPLFEKFGVDLVLSGAEHSYQRIGPVNGVTYLVSGGGGGMLYPVQADPNIAAYKMLYHYLLLEVEAGRIVGRMKDPRGIEEDRFEIETESNPVPPSQIQARPKLKKSQRYSFQ